jgi:phenylpyruvate tautomerase PptA (4-oxalocrotonate tautomerase family)
MPFVKINMSTNIRSEASELLVSNIRTALVEVLQIEETIY